MAASSGGRPPSWSLPFCSIEVVLRTFEFSERPSAATTVRNYTGLLPSIPDRPIGYMYRTAEVQTFLQRQMQQACTGGRNPKTPFVRCRDPLGGGVGEPAVLEHV